MAGRVERLVVHAVHERGVGAIGRGRHDHERCSGLQVQRRLVAVGEEPGRLDDHVDAEIAPRQLRRVTVLQHLQQVAVDGDAALGLLDLLGQDAEDRVVLQQVRHLVERAEVVDRHEVDVGAARPCGPEEVAADATEAVDADAYRHDARVLSPAGEAGLRA